MNKKATTGTAPGIRRAKRTENFSVRLPAELRALLESAAESSGQSLNSEIVSRLSASFELSTPARLLDARIREFNELSDRAARLAEEIAAAEREGPDVLSSAGTLLVYKRRELDSAKDAMKRAYADIEYYTDAMKKSARRD